MTPFLQLILVLAIILLFAKSAGYLSTRLGQPSILGELLVGVVLGPSLIDITHATIITDAHLHEVVIELGEIGVLLLMFLAGLELEFTELTRDKRVTVFGGMLGVVFPVLLGWGCGRLLGYPDLESIFLGLALGATSVSISAQTLIELKALRSRVGLGLLGAAVLDDILVILLLSTFLAMLEGGSGLAQILLVFTQVLAFMGISVAFGIYALPWLTRKVRNLSISQSSMTLAIIILLAYALAAELIGGVAAITGAFIAGLMFSRTPDKIEIEGRIRSIAYGFFVPIFFISIGLSVDLGALKIGFLVPALVISTVAILGKVIGAGLGSRIGGFSSLEALQFGIGMISRGEVGLIIAQLGIQYGILGNDMFTSLISMVLVTTLATPPLLRAAFSRKDSQPHKSKNSEHPAQGSEAS